MKMKFNNLLEKSLFEVANKKSIGDIIFEENYIMHFFISNEKFMSLTINFDSTAVVAKYKTETPYEYKYNREQYLKAAKKIRKWQGYEK